MATTADRVRELILASGLSQHAFAQEIGLDDSKLSKSLSGARRFSSFDLARIAQRWTVTVDWLITGEEPALAVAARTTGGSAGAALAEARRLVTMRTDLAKLGYPQNWRLPAVHPGSDSWFAQGGRLAEVALTRSAATSPISLPPLKARSGSTWRSVCWVPGSTASPRRPAP